MRRFMISVVIALTDVGTGFQYEEVLQRAGLAARWRSDAANGPVAGASDVVILDADHVGQALPAVCDAWRNSPHTPGIVAVGSSDLARELAPQARIILLAAKASPQTLIAAIHEAAKFRLASTMSWPVARAALNLPPAEPSEQALALTILAARAINLDIPRAALRWYTSHYVTTTNLMEGLREARLLTVPELAMADLCNGTFTMQSILKRCANAAACARFIWVMTSLGAMTITPAMVDARTPARRLLAELIEHLRARKDRLARSTYYDVLEVTPDAEDPEIDHAVELLGRRFAPELLNQYDLGPLGATVAPQWELVLKAQTVLQDMAARGQYHDWMRANESRYKTVWAIDSGAAQNGKDAFARGQTALAQGDVHKAMGEMAAACRFHPGHPDYEANLAWTRFRVQVASGKDKNQAADAERAAVEKLLWGCRPWPRALVALALLCSVSGDIETARWYLSQALSVDPSMPAALQLLQRLSAR